MKQQTTTLPLLSNSGRFNTNPPLRRSTSNASALSPYHQMFVTTSCSTSALPSRLPLKKLNPDAWQRLFNNKSQWESPTSRTDSNVDVETNQEFLPILKDGSVVSDNSQQPLSPTLQTHVSNLHEHIHEIALELSDERLQHRQSRVQAQEMLANQTAEQERKLQELRQTLKIDQEKAMKEQEDNFLALLQQEKTESLKREEQLKDELAFIKKSFHTFKISIEKEKARKRQLRGAELLTTAANDISVQREQGYMSMDDVTTPRSETYNRRRYTEVETRQEQYENEIEKLRNVLAETTVDRERLQSLSKQLASTKFELAEAQQNVINLTKELDDLKSSRTKPTQKLNGYR